MLSAQIEYSQASGHSQVSVHGDLEAGEVESAEIEYSQASAASVPHEEADEAESAEIEYSQASSVKTASVATSSGSSRGAAALLDVDELQAYTVDEVEGPGAAGPAAASTSVASDVLDMPGTRSLASGVSTPQRFTRRSSSGFDAGHSIGSAATGVPDEAMPHRQDMTRSLSTSFHAPEGAGSMSAALVQDSLTGEAVQDASALFAAEVEDETHSQPEEEAEYSDDFDDVHDTSASSSSAAVSAVPPAVQSTTAATVAAASAAAERATTSTSMAEDVEEEVASVVEEEEELEVQAPAASQTYSDDFAATSALVKSSTASATFPAPAVPAPSAVAVRDAPAALAAVRRLASDSERGETILDASDLLESMLADEEPAFAAEPAAQLQVPAPGLAPPPAVPLPISSYTMDFSGMPGEGASDGLRSNSMDEAEAVAAATAAAAVSEQPAAATLAASTAPVSSTAAPTAAAPVQLPVASHELDDAEAASVDEESIQAGSSLNESSLDVAAPNAPEAPGPPTQSQPEAPGDEPAEPAPAAPVQERSLSVQSSQGSIELQGPESSEEEGHRVASAEASDDLADIHNAFVQHSGVWAAQLGCRRLLYVGN